LTLVSFGQKAIAIGENASFFPISQSIHFYNDPSGNVSAEEAKALVAKGRFQQLSSDAEQENTAVQWLYFHVQNTSEVPQNPKINLAFMDEIDVYVTTDSIWRHFKTGDLLPLDEREVKIGQMCFVAFSIPPHQTATFLVRIKSSTDISMQFRSVALRSVQLYSEQAFHQRFEASRIYQAMFYGAILIMLFYNLFIYSTTLSFSYVTYVGFLFALILFMASNNGYVAELILPNYPRLDLYIRFLSAPLLVISFLFFALHYLELSTQAPKLHKITLALIGLFILIGLIMACGAWRQGRSWTIQASILAFLYVFYVAFSMSRKGYTPANYFLIANFTLILGASFYALERSQLVVNNPFTQYSVQLSVVFQSIFFSIGLSDRIKLITKQIVIVEREKFVLEQQKEADRKRLIEEKNEALEKSNKELDTFIYRTAHDIRGPLARLLGLSNLGLMDIEDEKALKYMSMIRTDADFLNYLLNRLSTAHEIKNQEVFISSFQLNKVVQEVLSNLSFQEDYKKVAFQIEIEKDAIVCSDLGLVRFIGLNLLDNAIKFRKENDAPSSPILIQAEIADEGVTLCVTDFGLGVKEEEVPYLFDMFSKAAGKFHTAGLGLYMTHLCVQKLGGTIRLKSNSQPTVFEVWLPNVLPKGS